MISDALQKCTYVIFVLFGTVRCQMMQMPYPMSGYGQMMMPGPQPMMPMPMAVPVPVPIPIPYPEPTTTTTTSTTEKPEEDSVHDIRIPIAIPVPHFVQFAIPGFESPACQNGKKKGKPCPLCPPCTCKPCTPSFFSYCSPCHQQCRCKNGEDAPSPQEPQPPRPLAGPAFPMPIPMPVQPPVVIVPFPPHFNAPHHDCYEHSSTEDRSKSTSASCSDESGYSRKKKRKKNRKRKYDIYRRHFGYRNRERKEKNELIQPMLSYMSRNGDVKMTRRLSKDEANALVGESDSMQNVHLEPPNVSNNRHRVVVMSKSGMRNGNRRRQAMLRRGMSQHVMGKGRKELLFRTHDNAKISNLSVSFQLDK